MFDKSCNAQLFKEIIYFFFKSETMYLWTAFKDLSVQLELGATDEMQSWEADLHIIGFRPFHLFY